mmetsp:Transcript_6826/g.21585  ORF Transcript_6826/g.21585 Transcript_6826/m.21585 type:complete len:539 (-) Transcript_6826:233-1849(-)
MSAGPPRPKPGPLTSIHRTFSSSTCEAPSSHQVPPPGPCQRLPVEYTYVPTGLLSLTTCFPVGSTERFAKSTPWEHRYTGGPSQSTLAASSGRATLASAAGFPRGARAASASAAGVEVSVGALAPAGAAAVPSVPARGPPARRARSRAISLIIRLPSTSLHAAGWLPTSRTALASAWPEGGARSTRWPPAAWVAPGASSLLRSGGGLRPGCSGAAFVLAGSSLRPAAASAAPGAPSARASSLLPPSRGPPPGGPGAGFAFAGSSLRSAAASAAPGAPSSSPLPSLPSSGGLLPPDCSGAGSAFAGTPFDLWRWSAEAAARRSAVCRGAESPASGPFGRSAVCHDAESPALRPFRLASADSPAADVRTVVPTSGGAAAAAAASAAAALPAGAPAAGSPFSRVALRSSGSPGPRAAMSPGVEVSKDCQVAGSRTAALSSPALEGPPAVSSPFSCLALPGSGPPGQSTAESPAVGPCEQATGDSRAAASRAAALSTSAPAGTAAADAPFSCLAPPGSGCPVGCRAVLRGTPSRVRISPVSS